MKKFLTFIVLIIYAVEIAAQSPEQVVRNYVSILNDFLMSPNNSSARKKLETTLDGSIIQDDIYIKYKENVSIGDIKARDYVGILADVINSDSDNSYSKVAIACNLETTNGGTDVVAYLAYTGAISMNTVTVFHVESGRIKAMANDFIKTKAWADGKTPCSTSTPTQSPSPSPSPMPISDPPRPSLSSNDNNVGSSGNHEFVDLGLPSGTLWATCNVGANNPWEYGDYFAWGETTPKTDYGEFTYKYNKYGDGDDGKFTKYCYKKKYGYKRFTDSLTTLERSDDVAFVHWGNNWCMPTESQWRELEKNATWTRTTRNGINGIEVKGLNENSIFLPAAGEKTPLSINGNASWVGFSGYYWSSSLDLHYPRFAQMFIFNDNRYPSTLHSYRYYGYPVRPVRCQNSQ